MLIFILLNGSGPGKILDISYPNLNSVGDYPIFHRCFMHVNWMQQKLLTATLFLLVSGAHCPTAPSMLLPAPATGSFQEYLGK